MGNRGGARPNAGRKPGSLNSKTAAIIREAAANGETPLEYMLRVMRTSTDNRRKDAMAIAAAPYIHPRLASVEHKGDPESPIVTQNISDVDRPGRESREEFIARRQSEIETPTQH